MVLSKEKRVISNSKYFQKNKKKLMANHKKYAKKNRERIRAIGRASYLRNREKHLSKFRRVSPYYRSREGKLLLTAINSSSKRNLAIWTLSNGETPTCACCGCDNMSFLEIDHVKPQTPKASGKKEHPSTYCKKILTGKSKPKEYQLLCAGCNKKKLTNKRCTCQDLSSSNIKKEDLCLAFLKLVKN